MRITQRDLDFYHNSMGKFFKGELFRRDKKKLKIILRKIKRLYKRQKGMQLVSMTMIEVSSGKNKGWKSWRDYHLYNFYPNTVSSKRGDYVIDPTNIFYGWVNQKPDTYSPYYGGTV